MIEPHLGRRVNPLPDNDNVLNNLCLFEMEQLWYHEMVHHLIVPLFASNLCVGQEVQINLLLLCVGVNAAGGWLVAETTCKRVGEVRGEEAERAGRKSSAAS